MIKTIDTSQITEEMFKAFRLGDDLSGKIFNLLEAAPEVKTRPIGTLFLGGIEVNEYGEIDVDLKSKALEALQEELVSSENPVVLEVYAHPPAVSEGWIRAIDEALVCHHIDVANADDSYAIAKDKLNKMLCVVQDIGAYFAKQEPAQAVPVAYGFPNTAITGKNQTLMMVRLEIPSDDQYGGALWVPLFLSPPIVPPAIDETQQRALDFVRWIASLKTGGLIQARANDILKLREAGDEN